MNEPKQDHCFDCDLPVAGYHSWVRGCHPCARKECKHYLCSHCAGTNPLILDMTVEKPLVQCFCSPCFRELSTLNFDRTYDIVQPPFENPDGPPSNIVFLFVHAGGGSRASFRKHAEVLVEKYHHTCILLDLPGHGSLVDKPLTLESCAETVSHVMEECNEIIAEKTVIYVGACMGAYTGMYVLNQLPPMFHGAILFDCGQSVGPKASMKSRLGLILMKQMGSHVSNAFMMSLSLSMLSNRTVDFYLQETCFGAGMFFQQAAAQVECLQAVEPAKLIPLLDMPILFMNGSEDYRDSEDQWLSLCRYKEESSLKIYEGGDHFFVSDSRFVDDVIHRWNEFGQSVHKKKNT